MTTTKFLQFSQISKKTSFAPFETRRIGKYNSDHSHPHPLLVMLNSTAEVRHVFAHRRFLPSPIIVKPDRSPAERKVEKILLSERWNLIQAGILAAPLLRSGTQGSL